MVVVVDHLEEIEEMIGGEEVASEGIEEIQTVGMIAEEEVAVVHAILATDLDTLLEIALTVEEMIAGEEAEEALEGIEVAVVEVDELATIVTGKDIWQETVQMVIGEIEEEDNFHMHKKTD